MSSDWHIFQANSWLEAVLSLLGLKTEYCKYDSQVRNTNIITIMYFYMKVCQFPFKIVSFFSLNESHYLILISLINYSYPTSILLKKNGYFIHDYD